MDKEKRTLAEGEVTGHAHILDKTEVRDVNGVKEFDVIGTDAVRHDEHKVIELPQDEYASDRVIEYDHFLEESRKTKD